MSSLLLLLPSNTNQRSISYPHPAVAFFLRELHEPLLGGTGLHRPLASENSSLHKAAWRIADHLPEHLKSHSGPSPRQCLGLTYFFPSVGWFLSPFVCFIWTSQPRNAGSGSRWVSQWQHHVFEDAEMDLLFAINYSKKTDSLWRADLFPEILTIS